ncbi:protein LKAAEAR1 [Dromaius novaehollandiae]|uniref:LKAAEAR motif containing 1 n=1 Tax=Dromaius novaehollandiae TaxID=8790 RepID=A0A8C4IXQ1_DRONO|nr:protein LKAAEAR1 [Dromaius novaehollandiae]
MTSNQRSSHKEKIIPQTKSVPPFNPDRMSDREKARYLAFTEPTDEKTKAMLASHIFMMDNSYFSKAKPSIDTEQKKEARVFGLLRAAEARNRLRNLRLRYQDLRAKEINHLISCQQSVLGALRLETFLAPQKSIKKLADNLDRVQRSRIEAILEDEKGEIFIRRP